MATQLSEREKHILRFFYDNQDDCCIDDGNVLAHYSDCYDDWGVGESAYDTAVEQLEKKGLIGRDDPPMDCFISITDKGIQAYEVK